MLASGSGPLASRVMLLAALGCATGCGSSPAPRAKAAEATPAPSAEGIAPPPFPTRDAIAALAARPAPPSPEDMPHAYVPRWTITATPAAADAAEVDDSKWTTLARTLVDARKGAALSPSLRCFAHELAAFHAANSAAPNEGLHEYLGARCGWPYPIDRSGVFRLDKVPSSFDDDALFTKKSAELAAALDRTLPKEAGHLGLATLRSGARFTVAWAWSSPRATIEPTSTELLDGIAHVRGSYPVDGARFVVLANGAGYDVRSCISEDASSPSFAYACAASGKGEPTWVTLSAIDPGRFLGRRVAAFLLDANDDASLTWTAPPFPDTPATTAPEAFGDAILAPLNELRRSLRLPPLTITVAQSKTNAALAPHAANGADPAAADAATLGALAGWDVDDGTIRSASAVVTQVAVHSPGEWLGELLATPVGRSVLLDPTAERLAIGARAEPGTSIVTSLVVAYTLVHGDVHDDVARAFVARVGAERARHRKKKIDALELPGVEASARAIATSGKDPTVAAREVGDAVARATHRTTYMVAVSTVDPAATPLPPALLGDDVAAWTVAVGHRKRPDSPWAELVVLWAWSTE